MCRCRCFDTLRNDTMVTKVTITGIEMFLIGQFFLSKFMTFEFSKACDIKGRLDDACLCSQVQFLAVPLL